MAKLKLTKNELKRQKDKLKRFTRYLPTLELKKQQLLAEIRRIQDEIDRKREELARYRRGLEVWIAVFGEDVDLNGLVRATAIRTGMGNIAGIDIPVFEGVDYEVKPYDFERYPLWVDRGIVELKTILAFEIELEVLDEQQRVIREELRVTMQRINLFEKIMIPQTREHIRRIRIFLGDQQTAEVVRGKIAKNKLEKKKVEATV